MFDFLKPKPKPAVPAPQNANANLAIREVMFGDVPISNWPRPENTAAGLVPWSYFVDARTQMAQGRNNLAVESLRKVIDAPYLEPRHYVEAWHFLRGLGVQPYPEIAKTLFGTVIEVGMPDGFDLLVAYSDRTARYLNFSGSGVIWEHPDTSLDPAIDSLLAASTRVVAAIGPWLEPRRPAPANDIVRVNFLTPSGLHFGEGPMTTLMEDPLSEPVLHAGINLMTLLMEKSKSAPKSV